MYTQEIRKQIIAAFNHRMDGNARRESPHLTEKERFLLALNDLVEAGLTEIKENDLVHALASAEKAHITRKTQPSKRGGPTLTDEQADHANQVVHNILELFQQFGGFSQEEDS